MKKNRREFLLSSAVALPASLSISSLLKAQPLKVAEVFAQTHNFLIHPELLVRLNERLELVSASPWAISKADADLLPYIIGNKRLNVPIDDEHSVAPFTARAALSNKHSTVNNTPRFSMERLASFRIMGDVPVADIVGEFTLALANNQPIELKLNFNDSLLYLHRPAHHAAKQANILTVPLLQPHQDSMGTSTFVPLYIRIPIPIPFTNYNLQFRGPDSGSMPGCAPEVRRHWHLEVSRNTGVGNRTVPVANFHIAVWRSGRQLCFAIANSEGRPVCLRKCSPTWTDIKNAVQASLIRYGVPLALAAVMAAAVATIIYGSLSALVLA